MIWFWTVSNVIVVNGSRNIDATIALIIFGDKIANYTTHLWFGWDTNKNRMVTYGMYLNVYMMEQVMVCGGLFPFRAQDSKPDIIDDWRIVNLSY